jgi:hypothetical protein
VRDRNTKDVADCDSVTSSCTMDAWPETELVRSSPCGCAPGSMGMYEMARSQGTVDENLTTKLPGPAGMSAASVSDRFKCPANTPGAPPAAKWAMASARCCALYSIAPVGAGAEGGDAKHCRKRASRDMVTFCSSTAGVRPSLQPPLCVLK